uniref:Uncharacterized protein n=1 Tax=Anopheles culicifacies TaxID=139723 RepID=A0A182MCX7_9DIPT
MATVQHRQAAYAWMLPLVVAILASIALLTASVNGLSSTGERATAFTLPHEGDRSPASKTGTPIPTRWPDAPETPDHALLLAVFTQHAHQVQIHQIEHRRRSERFWARLDLGRQTMSRTGREPFPCANEFLSSGQQQKTTGTTSNSILEPLLFKRLTHYGKFSTTTAPALEVNFWNKTMTTCVSGMRHRGRESGFN